MAVHQETLSQLDRCWARQSVLETTSKSLVRWKMKLAGGLWALNKTVQNSIKTLLLLFLTNERMKDRSSKSNLRSLKNAVSAPDLNSLANKLQTGRKAEGLSPASLQELQTRPSTATHYLQNRFHSKSVNLSFPVWCFSSLHILH